MKSIFVSVLFFIALALTISSCRVSSYSARYVSADAKKSQPVVFDQDFIKALYKTDLNVYGRALSGITIIKKDTTGFHVALVSEVGLKYFELFFPTDTSGIGESRYVMEVMNHKPVVDKLLALYGLLLAKPLYDSHARLLMNETGKTCLLINKAKSKHIRFYYNVLSGKVEELKSSQLFKPNYKIRLSEYVDGKPGKIVLYSRKVSIQLDSL